jgi:ADP-ribose pyrophosphatase YjhB (NUDIX family)
MEPVKSGISFCRRCGHSLVTRWLESELHERDVCASCGWIDYRNPKLLVTCMVHWGDRLLLCRRGVEPAKGLWYPPTGFVEAGETLEEAVARELREESGVQINPSELALYAVASLPHMNQIYVAYRGELHAEPQLIPGPEALEVKLFGEQEVQQLQIAFSDMVGGFPRTFFSRLRNAQFPVPSVTLRRDSPAVSDNQQNAPAAFP